MSFSVIDADRAGALIPVEAAVSIVRAATAESAALTLCRRVRMSSKTQTTPILAETVDAYWVKSGGLKGTTSAKFEDVELEAEELAAIAVAELDVIDDSAYPIWQTLEPEFAAAIARKLDAAVFAGTERPDTWARSILEGAVDAGAVVEAGASVEDGGVYGDLAALLDNLEGRGVEPTGWLARRGVRGLMRRARSTTGESLAASMDLSRAFDLPITWDQQNALPEGVLALAGDWNHAVVGVRQDMNLETFREGVITDETGKILANLMQEDRAAVRVTFRSGFATTDPVRIADGGTRPYPFAALVTSDFVPAAAEPTTSRKSRKS